MSWWQNRRRRWRATWNPDMYHGWGRTENYFEGWYVKLVDPSGQFVFAVIPGISMDEKGESHAFIQVLDGIACQASYHEFEDAAFRPDPERFALQLGNNYFSSDKIKLDLPELKGNLQLSGRFPWPKMLGAPGIMGWYSFVPFMECYHGVVSMDHRLEGTLQVHGSENIDFSGGKGYMEKDWGVSFPSAWIWMQTNHFDSEDRVSLMASVANIPWLGSSFTGYIVGFLWKDRLFRFATYTGAKMEVHVQGEEVSLTFRDRTYRLEIRGRQGRTGGLVSPVSGEMTGKVNESMQATIDVQLFENDHLLFSGQGRHAGLEVAGEVATLIPELSNLT
jgi:tocopherol cyclase